jgi:hypothetical protein
LLAFLFPFASVSCNVPAPSPPGEYREVTIRTEALTGWELVRGYEPAIIGGGNLSPERREDMLSTVDEIRFSARVFFVANALTLSLALVQAVKGRPILEHFIQIACGVVVFLALVGRILTDLSSGWEEPTPHYCSGFYSVILLSGLALGMQRVGFPRGRALTLGMLFMAAIMVLIGVGGLIAGSNESF